MITESYCFDDLLLIPKFSTVSSRSKVDLSVKIRDFTYSHPFIPANMKTITGKDMAASVAKSGGLALLHRFMPIEEQIETASSIVKEFGKAHIGVSVGVKENDKEYVDRFVGAGIEVICIDIAHGHSAHGIGMTKWIRGRHPDVLLISGNVATGEGAEALWKAGADVVKCGVGSGCFAAGTRILMSNGTCKNIEEVVPGERVINKSGDPVTVKTVVMTGIKEVVKLKHDLATKETFVTPDHQYWVGDCNTMNERRWIEGDLTKQLDKLSKTIPKQSKFKWKPVEQLKQDCFLMPRIVKWELPETFEVKVFKRSGGDGRTKIVNSLDAVLTPTYEVGYIFGTHLGDGHAMLAQSKPTSKIGAVSWYFGLNEIDIVQKLNNCIRIVFSKELAITQTESIYNCTLYYKPLAEFLASFGKKNNKHLPQELLVNNREYLQGILDGLIDSDGHIEEYGRKRMANTSERVIELFSVLSQILNGTFTSNIRKDPSAGNLENCNIENCHDGYVGNINTTAHKKLTKDYQVSQIRRCVSIGAAIPVYDIEVDDDTHSFIANFAIVHNSLCSTRIMTGNGVPQMSALMDVARTQQSLQREIGRPIYFISDGGAIVPGDFTKALCFADMVMSGHSFAGCVETPSPSKTIDGVLHKEYVGSSTHKTSNIEGVEAWVPARGTFQEVLTKLRENLQSGCSYQGAHTLAQLKRDPDFIRVTQAGITESHPHNVVVIK